MRRRSFLKGIALGTAAGATLPLNALGPESDGCGCESARGSDGMVVERFTHDFRARSGMALGGIGAGTIELRKDGRFYNWNIFNNFPKETGPEFKLSVDSFEDPMASNLFFKVRYEVEGEEPRIKLLQLPSGMNEGGQMGIACYFPWMEAVDAIDYSARFPFARLKFSAAEMPFDIVMDAWTPFIPHDARNSALPLAFFDFTVLSKTGKNINVMLMMTARNNVGYDTLDKYYITEVKEGAGSKSVSMTCGGMDEKSSTWGQIAMSSLAGDSTHYCGWSAMHPYYEYVLRHRTLPNLDDTDGTASIKGQVPAWMPPTEGRNHTDPKTGVKRVMVSENDPDTRVFGTLARSFELRGNNSHARHSFVYSWNFPNLYAEQEFRHPSKTLEGHYYSNFFQTALEVAEYAAVQRESLHHRSRQFLDNFFDSSADTVVLEQVNSQLNTFVTSGRLVKNGSFGILEGLASTWSWGPVATMDVMLYGTAPIIALFPELQKATMRCHSRAQNDRGQVPHGLGKNFGSSEDGPGRVSERVDLPGQYIMMVMRDFFWTNDREFLKELYPTIKKAIDFNLNYRSFNGGQIPVMRGGTNECSYDNFPMFGYASYLVSQWLCAVAGAIQAADVMGDSSAKARFQAVFEETQRKMEQKLWNGQYYRLYNDADKGGSKGDVSEGCLTDQIIGQWMAHHSDLGYLLKKENVDAALKHILGVSYKPGFGLRNCSWPGAGYWSDVDRDIWVDQGNTCWSGVELAFASFLLYEGFYREAMDLIKTVDARYRKNGLYWDHQEFGGHYFRAMSAWSIVNALLGFSINCGKFRFNPQLKQASFKLFFATPTGTAHYIKSPIRVVVKCLTGSLVFDEVELKGAFKGAPAVAGKPIALHANATSAAPGFSRWKFTEMLALPAGKEIVFA